LASEIYLPKAVRILVDDEYYGFHRSQRSIYLQVSPTLAITCPQESEARSPRRAECNHDGGSGAWQCWGSLLLITAVSPKPIT